MSYAIKIVSDGSGNVRIDDTGGATYGTVPKGTLTINGHEVAPGEVGYRTLSVLLAPEAPEGGRPATFVASAGGAHDRSREPAADTQPGGIDLREHATEQGGDPVPSSS